MKLNTISENANLGVDYISRLLPSRFSKIFNQAVAWQPKTQGWKHSVNQAVQSILAGEKPLGYGWKDDILDQVANKYDLVTKWDCVYLPENEPFAELIGYALAKFEIGSPIRHFIIGVCCGYPIPDVERFSLQYAHPSNELLQGIRQHQSGYTIR